MKVLIVFAFAVAAAVGKAVDPEVALPTSLKICKLNDPKRNECIKESIQTFLPSLRNKADNFELPSIDPFSYDSVTFNYKNSELLVGSFNLKDVKTYGMSRGKVESVKSEFTDDEMTIQADLFFPKLFSTGSYKSNMTLNLFKLNSKGQYNITLKEVKAKWNIKGKLEKDDDGELYMKIYKFDILPEANDMQISVSGLFPDEKLNKVVNDFFNQYWRLLYKEMIPETRKQWEPILLDIINKFFAQVPFRRLLIKE